MALVCRVEDRRQHAIVGPDADMILAGDLRDMLDMGDEVLAPRLAVGPEERHEIDADHAALVGDRLDRLVRRVARMIGHGARAGVADHQRPLGVRRPSAIVFAPPWLRSSSSFSASIRSIVARPSLTEARIGRLQRAVARQVAVVVGQLDGHHPVLLHLRQPVELRPDHRRILRAEKHRELLLPLGFQDVGGGTDQDQPVRDWR